MCISSEPSISHLPRFSCEPNTTPLSPVRFDRTTEHGGAPNHVRRLRQGTGTYPSRRSRELFWVHSFASHDLLGARSLTRPWFPKRSMIDVAGSPPSIVGGRYALARVCTPHRKDDGREIPDCRRQPARVHGLQPVPSARPTVISLFVPGGRPHPPGPPCPLHVPRGGPRGGIESKIKFNTAECEEGTVQREREREREPKEGGKGRGFDEERRESKERAGLGGRRERQEESRGRKRRDSSVFLTRILGFLSGATAAAAE
ncbi:hypothetical protein BHM03_00031568 [Ensete ventricosum]|nr:hypothetical protein BHM03_00031568 [Ensete ventricosum]